MILVSCMRSVAMSPRIFITGATGYVGGTVLHTILQAHPDWLVTALVRTKEQATAVLTQHPSINILHGDLDDSHVLTTAASESDIILHLANCDHEPSVHALLAGIRQRASSSPAHFIHLSGALNLAHESITNKSWGEPSSKVFNDWAGVGELTSLPAPAEHRAVDAAVLAASGLYPGRVRTAIVDPPLIYGLGTGSCNTRSKQIYRAAEAFITHRRAFVVGRGQNTWHHVHVRDLSRLFVRLAEAAIEGDERAGVWDAEGYYLAENGGFVWRDVLQELAERLVGSGLLETAQLEQVGVEEADRLMPYARYMLGTSSRGEAMRARLLFGWVPKEGSLLQELDEVVRSEAARLGLLLANS